nr:PREDICTED: cell cycle checkpoint protein RAD17 isoform X2 [Bemisia tabaci]
MASGKTKKSNWVKPSFDDAMIDSAPPKKKSRPEETKDTSQIPRPAASSSSNMCTWLDTAKPTGITDLAPTKSKVGELENWLTEVKTGRLNLKYLLVTGPSGCGKTSTIHTLAKHLGFKIIEWITPIDKVRWMDNEEQVENQTKVFADFLTRGSRYGNVLSSQSNARLIIVKDFPNVFVNTPHVFHELLTDYYSKILSPVIFICDGKKAFKLFPPEILRNLNISQITFSAVCFRTVKQILLKILKANKISAPPDDSLKEIYVSSGMDLRNCILQAFYTFSVKQSRPKFTFRKTESEPTESSDGRIELFQTTGRVLYPKCETVLSPYGYNIQKFTHNPDHLVSFYENNRSDLKFLHHNYLSTFSSISDVSKAAEDLTISDMLWNSYADNRLTNQNLALSIAVRGLMCANKKPLKGYRQFGAAKIQDSLSFNSDFLTHAKNVLPSIQGNKDLLLDYAPFLKSSLRSSLNEKQNEFFNTYFSTFKKPF